MSEAHILDLETIRQGIMSLKQLLIFFFFFKQLRLTNNTGINSSDLWRSTMYMNIKLMPMAIL